MFFLRMAVLIFCFVSSSALALTDMDKIQKLKTDLVKIDTDILNYNKEWAGFQPTVANYQQLLDKNCKKVIGDFEAYYDCTQSQFKSISEDYSKYLARIKGIQTKIQSNEDSFNKMLNDAKQKLSSEDFAILLSHLSNLSDTKLKNAVLQLNSNKTKDDIERLKKDVESSRAYRLASKAILETLNSKLLCEVATSCNSEKQRAVTKREVDSQIMKKIIGKTATEEAKSTSQSTASK